MKYIADLWAQAQSKVKLSLYCCAATVTSSTPGVAPTVYYGYGVGHDIQEARKHFYPDLLAMLGPYDRVDMADIACKKIDFKYIEQVYLDNV